MTQPLQSVLQAEIRKLTGKTTQDFNGDLHDLCSYYGIPMAPISGRAIGLAKIFRSDISTASAALNYLQANATQVVGPGGLFANGEPGAWYDPSDSTTLFSDTAGTTPVAQPGAGAQVVVGRMLDKSGNGNHAISYNSTTARPELSARVNLLTYSEQFDNAAWVKVNATVSANAGVAPDGTNTADLVYPSSSGNYSGNVYQTGRTGNRLSVCAKAAGFQWLYFVNTGGTAAVVWFDVLNGITGTVGAGYTATITSLGNGWYRCTAEAASGNFPSPQFGPSNTDNSVLATASGTNGLLFWGADLRPANIGTSVPAYQRIADQYTYDNSASFPRYLRFDGVDDGMSTPANLNLSSTDKATVFAGVRKLSDAASGILVALSAAWNANTGTFAIYAPSYITGSFPAPKYIVVLRGSANREEEYATYTAPISNVLSASFDIGASVPSETTMRINGATISPTSAVGTAGAGNFGSYPLIIGTYNLGSTFLNGNLYSLIVRGAATDASTISATETWVAGKTGITI